MSRWPNKYVIGLTGNIAVGKSVVRQMLQHSGAYTIDADGLSHQAMMPGAPAYKPVVSTFGQLIVGPDGRIDRKQLGNIVFSNPDALAKLERIVHPVVRQAINALVSRAKQRIVVIEAIKLLEGDLAEMVDTVWVVHSSPKTQYRRLLQKRKMSPDEAKKRILGQNSQAEKVKRADVVINNDGNVEQTWKQVQRQWALIRKQLAEAAKTAGQPSEEAEPVEESTPPKKSGDGAVGNVEVKRGMPNNAKAIAEFIKTVSGREVSRMDVMESFGQKSYLLAQNDANDDVVGLMGWTVENLVTSMDEFYLASNAVVADVVREMVIAIEEASKELQSEVGFIFLSVDTPKEIVQAFQNNGYEPITLPEIKIPAWREAVEQAVSDKQMHVLWKQLRKDRVLQPI